MSDQPHPEEEYMQTADHPAITRVRALQAQQWPLGWIAAQLGCTEISFLADGIIPPETDQRVTELFERIGDRKGPCEDAAAEARALGFWPAIHYDDDMRFIRGSIRGAYQLGDPERYRRYLVIAALDARDHDYADICRVMNVDTEDRAFEKQVGRARKEIGLRIKHRMIFDPSKLHPEQAPLHRAIHDHTRGIAVFEMVDELDAPDLDYRALWRSLCDTADLLMGAGAAALSAAEMWPPETDTSLAATQRARAA